MISKNRITIGKEYELAERFFYQNLDRYKHNDGSGPSEISSPVFSFSNWEEAVAFEYFLLKMYGRNLLFDYYVRNDGREEKGCHFHFRSENPELMYQIYLMMKILILSPVSKVLTMKNRFRNNISEWISFNDPYSYNYFLSYYRGEDYGRSYYDITMNTNNKDILTFEVRISEGSIVGDILVLLLSLLLTNKIDFDFKNTSNFVNTYSDVVDELYNQFGDRKAILNALFGDKAKIRYEIVFKSFSKFFKEPEKFKNIRSIANLIEYINPNPKDENDRKLVELLYYYSKHNENRWTLVNNAYNIVREKLMTDKNFKNRVMNKIYKFAFAF